MRCMCSWRHTCLPSRIAEFDSLTSHHSWYDVNGNRVGFKPQILVVRLHLPGQAGYDAKVDMLVSKTKFYRFESCYPDNLYEKRIF